MNSCFIFIGTATTEIYPLSLHDALPICRDRRADARVGRHVTADDVVVEGAHLQRALAAVAVHLHAADRELVRSEEHTSELQSRRDLVCRLLLEKKNDNHFYRRAHTFEQI